MTDPELRELIEARFPKSKDHLTVQDGCLRYTYIISRPTQYVIAICAIVAIAILAVPQITQKFFIFVPIEFTLIMLIVEGFWNLTSLGKTLVIGPDGVSIQKSGKTIAAADWNQVHRILLVGTSRAILQDHERNTLLKLVLPFSFNAKANQAAETFSWIMQYIVQNAPPILIDRSPFLKISPSKTKFYKAIFWIGISFFPASLILFWYQSVFYELSSAGVTGLVIIVFASLFGSGLCGLFLLDLYRKDTRAFDIRPVVHSVGNTNLLQIHQSGELKDWSGSFIYQKSVHNLGYGGVSDLFIKFSTYFACGWSVFVVILVLLRNRGTADSFFMILFMIGIVLIPLYLLNRGRKSTAYKNYLNGLNDRLEFQNGLLLVHHNGETLAATSYTFTDPKKLKDQFKPPHQSLIVETDLGTHYYNSVYLVKLSDQELLEYLPEEFLD